MGVTTHEAEVYKNPKSPIEAVSFVASVQNELQSLLTLFRILSFLEERRPRVYLAVRSIFL